MTDQARGENFSKMTNYDLIKTMSIESMAYILHMFKTSVRFASPEEWLEWLNRPYSLEIED